MSAGEGSGANIDRRIFDGRQIDRLLLVRLGAMGDIIHTLPAAQALRQVFPNAMIGWLIEERWAELLCAPGTPRRGPRSERCPLADWVHTVSLAAWGKSLSSISTLQQIAKVWNDVRSTRYDVAVDLQGAIRSAVLARCAGAKMVYGSAEPREAPASLWYTRRVVARGVHVVEQNLSLAEAVAQQKLTLPRAGFPRDLEVERRMDQRLADEGLGPFAILNPGAGWGAKRWPAERYGQVARALAKDGVHTILNYGPGEENLAREAEAASGGAARVMKCSITELIALTRRARLFIGGDTGPMHLAAALQVPVAAIFGPTDPARNGPYQIKSHRGSEATHSEVLRNPASPTTHARNPHPDEAMLEISVDEVVTAARRLLAGAETRPQDQSPSTEGAHG